MAQTLTTERNLLRRQEEIEREVRCLNRMRILERRPRNTVAEVVVPSAP